MRKYIIGLMVFLLVGCSTTVSGIKLPEPTSFMQTECGQLKTLGENATKADVIQATANNSEMFFNCAHKVDDWNRFYEELRRSVN